jgi:hypothetical protein
MSGAGVVMNNDGRDIADFLRSECKHISSIKGLSRFEVSSPGMVAAAERSSRGKVHTALLLDI